MQDFEVMRRDSRVEHLSVEHLSVELLLARSGESFTRIVWGVVGESEEEPRIFNYTIS